MWKGSDRGWDEGERGRMYRSIEVWMYRGGRTSAVIASDPIRAGARRSRPHETAAVASLREIASSAKASGLLAMTSTFSWILDI